MKIKLDESNSEAIGLELARVQHKRVQVRTITTTDILSVKYEIEKRLNGFLKKKFFIDTVIDCNFIFEDFPKAYKHTPQSTKITVRYFSSGLFLTNIYRGNCKFEKKSFHFYFNQAQKDDILLNAISTIETRYGFHDKDK